ncbi:MAG: S8 family serine peptidase [Synechococcales cyanobacterium M58_A2018_015]|nr:S8 family serine peptidase [Synechococcales cyanobacterium M58_A2018_015]
MPLSSSESQTHANLPNKVVWHRGGETLPLQKVADRFTVCPAAEQGLRRLMQHFGDAATPILATRLLEVRTEPEQLESILQDVRALPDVAYASHVYCLPHRPDARLYLTDQLTLQFTEATTVQTIQSITTAVGLEVLKLVAGVPKAFVFRVTAQATANPLKLADALMQRSEVLLAEPNVAVPVQWHYRPRESNYAQQWYLHHEGGEALAADSHIHVEAAWDRTRGKRSIVVAVADDGVDLQHPDFQGEGKIVAPLDLKSGGFLPQAEPFRRHGTTCARLAVAEETGAGVIGVAPGCALMPIRIDDALDDQSIEQLFDWVSEQGADVVCCAWGAAVPYFPLSLRQRVAIHQAATRGRSGKGCVIVVAAGNANRPTDSHSLEQPWAEEADAPRWLNGFAMHPDVIAVAAYTSRNRKSASSNWGPGIAVAAPGGNQAPVLSGSTQAAASLLADLEPCRSILLGDTDEWTEIDETTGALGDTSSACALVAGVAALMLSVNPALRAAEVRQILQTSADKLLDPEANDLFKDSFQDSFKLALGQYDARGHSLAFGYGKVNASKAVAQAQAQQFMPLPARWIQAQQSTPLAIPDADPQGITSTITLHDAALAASWVQDIEVRVDIEHSFLGDLELWLIPPQGEAILLQPRTLGRLTALKTTYSLQTHPALAMALYQPVLGAWQLKLVDAIPGHDGRLHEWYLSLGITEEGKQIREG